MLKNHINQEKMPENFIFWQAPEFEYRPKSISWYWLSLIVTIILIALAIWQRNFLFIIFVVIAWLMVLFLTNRFPTIWEFKIDEKGLNISLPNKKSGNKFYSYKDIDGFDIHYGGEEYKELVLKIKKKFSPYLKVNIHTADEEKIKNFLIQYLPEEEYQISLIDSLANFIRF